MPGTPTPPTSTPTVKYEEIIVIGGASREWAAGKAAGTGAFTVRVRPVHRRRTTGRRSWEMFAPIASPTNRNRPVSLKEERRRAGSLVMDAAAATRVPAALPCG